MLIHQVGDIVLVAKLPDPQGRNPKDRPAVVISTPPLDNLDLDLSLDVMAITTLVPDPLPSNHILLPWQLPRHPRTGLNRRCAAVGTWLVTINPERVIRQVGIVPTRQRLEIAALLRNPPQAPRQIQGLSQP